MSPRPRIPTTIGCAALLSVIAFAAPAPSGAAPSRQPVPAGAAYTERSVGTPEQIAWVRRAAGNFVAAELSGDGAGACAILNAPLRRTEHGRTCQQRWNARLTRLLREQGARAQLRAEQRAIPSARVLVHGAVASIDLSRPLMGTTNRFLWSENCWMLEG